MKNRSFFTWIALLIYILFQACSDNESNEESIPLPEHPRPDFERADWVNLNGYWEFEFDGANQGETEGWFDGKKEFTQKILVPFPWGSPLSEVENKDDIAWYKRQITIPSEWKGMRVFLVVGASDWLTKGWIDGQAVGQYQGGYTPFEFELTGHAKFGSSQEICLRVDDLPHDFKLFGKQGYGDAKGIWQTVYLEARPETYIDNFYFTPDIDEEILNVRAIFDKEIQVETKLQLKYIGEESNYTIGEMEIKSGVKEVSFDVKIP
ncbi:MAG: glycoside hydrolase family 2, partial [Cyclobacteriaceae bacterium]|nr:glycoside hydrolase family 2 [Cyclobacteriaceae bacterium]